MRSHLPITILVIVGLVVGGALSPDGTLNQSNYLR
jgi:hypothetical protein